MRQMPHTVLLCLPLVFIRYMSVCAAHRKLHFSSSPLLTAAYAYTVSACLAATAPLVRRSPCPAHYPPQGSCTATAPSIVPSFLPRPPPASATAPLLHSSAVRPASAARPRPLAHPPPTVSPTPPHLLVFTPPAPACLPADALKRQSFSFLQSISNFIVSLQNVSEKT